MYSKSNFNRENIADDDLKILHELYKEYLISCDKQNFFYTMYRSFFLLTLLVFPFSFLILVSQKWGMATCVFLIGFCITAVVCGIINNSICKKAASVFDELNKKLHAVGVSFTDFVFFYT